MSDQFSLGDKDIKTLSEWMNAVQNNFVKLCGIPQSMLIENVKGTDTNMSSHAADALRYASWGIHEFGPVSWDRLEPGQDLYKECRHSWKNYQGLTNSFDYCEFCDLKR